MNIPALLILKSIENDDKEICSIFYPDMYDKSSETFRQVDNLKNFYESLRRRFGSYELYNLLEKCLIDVRLEAADQKLFTELSLEELMIKPIRCLAMQLSRYRPADWNKFLDVVIK